MDKDRHNADQDRKRFCQRGYQKGKKHGKTKEKMSWWQTAAKKVIHKIPDASGAGLSLLRPQTDQWQA